MMEVLCFWESEVNSCKKNKDAVRSPMNMEIVNMRKTRFVLIVLCLAGPFLQCNKRNISDPNNKTQGLSIKGRVAAVTLRKADHSHASRMSIGTAVQKVLVYRDFGEADVSPVDTNGNFSVNVERKACGLIFLDGSNTIVGYLSLSSGIEALPLMMINDAVAQIDMKDINIQDGVGTPQHNPIGAGGEAEMTPDELAAYKLQSALFSSIIRNLDMNNDGVIDVLSDRPYWLMRTVDFNGWTAPASDPGDSGTMPTLNVFHFNFSDYNVQSGTPQAELVTPDALHFASHDVGLYTFMKNGQPGTTASMYHWVLQGTSWSSFVTGNYLINYDTDKQITFNMNSPLNAENYIVAAHLWYETAGTKITKVHWKWKMQNGAPIDATRLLQKDVNLQFGYGVGVARVGNYHITSADVSCVVDEDAASLQVIGLFCSDLFGNQQVTNYSIR
jgi:hypothetical protein